MSDMAEAYLATVGRLEPDISPVDRDAALTSLAISAKRQADALDLIAMLLDSTVRPAAGGGCFIDVRDGEGH